MTDVVVILFLTTDVIGRCYCLVVSWPMMNAIVTDIVVTLCSSG